MPGLPCPPTLTGVTVQQPQSTPPGWYPDRVGVMRYWDGAQWTGHVAPPQPVYQPVWVQPNVRQAHDRAQYVRPQRGHSIIAHLFLGWVLLYIPTIYYAISPNHYFHA